CGFRGIARLGIGWCRFAPPQTVVDSDDRKSGASPDVLRGSNCGLSLGHCGVSVPVGTPSPLFRRATGSVLFCRNGAVDDLPFELGDRLDTLLRRSDRCIARCVARDGSSGMGRFRVHALLVAAAPLAASAFLSKRYRTAAVLGALIVAGFAVSNERTLLFRVRPGTLKAMQRHMQENSGARLTQTGWNAYSRIDAVEGFPPPNLARLYIDSDAWTNAQQWDGNVESIRNVRDWYRALPFRLVSSPETLVIGPGGGSDVLVALGSGSRKVTAVELNPLMLHFVRHYGERAGNIYNRSDVEVIESEGRSFISRTDRKFDVIFLGFVDTWASVASGGLSLSENYLYTTQAFEAYYDHLTE